MHTFRICMLLHIKKHKKTCTFVVVFKILQSLQCILNTEIFLIVIFRVEDVSSLNQTQDPAQDPVNLSERLKTLTREKCGS